MVSKSSFLLPVAACLLGFGHPILFGQAVADPNLGPALLRDAWAPESPRFVRAWQVQVPEGPQLAAALKAALGGTSPGASDWRPFQSWSDEIDVFEMASIPLRDRDGSRSLDVLARTTVTRDTASAAEISLGADGVVELWVNGASVFRRQDTAPFLSDGERIPVTFKAGANDLVVHFHCTGSPWKFSLRVAEPGRVARDPAAVAVAVKQTANGDLQVTPTRGPSDASLRGAATVKVTVLGPGGEVLAEAEGHTEQPLRFTPATWADGPVEIRCAARDAWGRTHLSFTPWFKGDPLIAARDLVQEAAKAPPGADGDTLRLLATLVRQRAGEQLDARGPWLWQTLHPVLMEYRELQRQRDGRTGAERPSGFARIAYVDPVDGSTQFGRVYFPSDYSREKPAPLLVVLHGFNPPNPPISEWWSVDRRHDRMADEKGLVVLEVHGRGNAQYQGPGEQDVLRAIGEVKRRYAVDGSRVYLLGESMGGHGTWRIASRHPNLFAAAAPYFGGWDFRLTPTAAGGFAGLAPRNRWEAFTLEAASSFANAESLANVPLFVSHGDADPTVNIAYTRHAVQQLERWGYDVRYQEVPGFGHEDLDTRDRVIDWLLAHRRDPAPRSVQLRAPDLGSAQSGWLTVTALHAADEFVRVRAELLAPDLVRLDTMNADAVELTPPQSAALDSLHVVWNGREFVARRAGDRFQVSQPGARLGSHAKKAGVEGPISDVIAHPFLVVIGTISPDVAVRRICQIKADAFADAWRRWQHVAPRVKTDREVTADDKRRFSLILIGGPDANDVAREFAERLPLRVTPDAIEISGRRWPAKDALGVALHLNPVNPDEYVLEVAGNSARGLALWNPLLWVEPFGNSAVFCDWYVKDSLRVVLPAGRFAPNSYVAFGVFDPAWTRTDAETFEGDPAARAAGVPRGDMTASSPSDEHALAAFAGDYELFPGVTFRVSAHDQSLWFAPPGMAEFRVAPEGAAEFGLLQNGAQLRFETNSDGTHVAILNTEGKEIVLRRK
jgi:poly(3-hydroxybutyrate) depolymerase